MFSRNCIGVRTVILSCTNLQHLDYILVIRGVKEL